MMGQHDRSEALFYYFRLEDQIPETHLLRGVAVEKVQFFPKQPKFGAGCKTPAAKLRQPFIHSFVLFSSCLLESSDRTRRIRLCNAELKCGPLSAMRHQDEKGPPPNVIHGTVETFFPHDPIVGYKVSTAQRERVAGNKPPNWRRGAPYRADLVRGFPRSVITVPH